MTDLAAAARAPRNDDEKSTPLSSSQGRLHGALLRHGSSAFFAGAFFTAFFLFSPQLCLEP